MNASADAKPIVVKVGGASVAGGALADLPGLAAGGTPVAVVHGGGKQLTRMLDALGIESEFREGLRVTDEETMRVAEMVFAGEVNGAVVRDLAALGLPAVGVSGTDGGLLRVEPVEGLGRVGAVSGVGTALVEALWRGGFLPVVAPIGLGPVGANAHGAFNVNADSAAAALAVALGAGHLFFLTDVDGFLVDGEAVAGIPPEECEGLVRRGVAAGGMAPKLRAAAVAAKGGVRVRILSGNEPGVLARAVAGENVGTLIAEGVAA